VKGETLEHAIQDLWIRKLTEFVEEAESLRKTWGEMPAEVRVEIVEGQAESESYDMGRIKWMRTEGFKGEYERSEDVDNPDFKALLRDLSRHGGKMTRDGYFVWVFRNGNTIGRKKRNKVKN